MTNVPVSTNPVPPSSDLAPPGRAAFTWSFNPAFIWDRVGMAPCEPWPPAPGCCTLTFPAGWSDEQQADLWDSSLKAATEVLWALSGRQYGYCMVTERPCLAPEPCVAPVPVTPSRCIGYRLELQRTPVVEIVDVTIAGIVLDPSMYARVGNSAILYARPDEPDLHLPAGDGTYPWPTYQSWADIDPVRKAPKLAKGQAVDLPTDAWSITYRYGTQVPAIGQRAVAALACELAKSCIPGAGCALPERVTSITRQGVTMAMLDPMDFVEKGRTGIYLVDLFLATVNPAGVRRRARVFRADDERFAGGGPT